MIEMVDLHKAFNNQKVLNGVNLRIEDGKVITVMGKSGCGKSVLIKHIIGLLQPDSGKILIDGVDITTLDRKDLDRIREKLGVLFQGGALFDSLTVEENVMFPLDMMTSQSKKEKLDRINFCLEHVRVKGSNKLYPSELSGGMKKRVAIARAIALNPHYLLCDEPNSGLDPETGIVIDNLIKELTEEFNMTTIVNSHDMNSVLEIGDNVVFIYNGCKCWEGTRQEILHTDNEALNNFVFATNMARQIKGK